MKPLKSFPTLVFLTLSLLGCSKNEAPTPTAENEVITTILPLGASRVAGARPFFESFRYPLWKQLIDGGWSFDFIGTRKDAASYEDYKGQVFDVDHEGRLGWTSGQLLNGIASWLEQAGTPDVVLFSSPGGNDALQGLSYEQALENIAAIIDILQDNNPEVTIIIEQMAPGRSDVMTQALTSLFETMKQAVSTLANAKTTAQSQVIAVDMFTEFNDSFFADGVHYPRFQKLIGNHPQKSHYSKGVQVLAWGKKSVHHKYLGLFYPYGPIYHFLIVLSLVKNPQTLFAQIDHIRICRTPGP